MPWRKWLSRSVPIVFLARLLVARSAYADDSAGPAQPATAPPPSTTAGEPTPIAPAPSPSARTPAAYPSARGHDARAISVAHPTPLEDGESGSGVARPIAGEVAPNPDEVFSESWWGHARPVIELHGYFRTRAELFQNFMLGRRNTSVQSTTSSSGTVTGNDPAYLFPSPLDNSYGQPNGNAGQTVNICGNASTPNQPCYDKSESGANLRLRLTPRSTSRTTCESSRSSRC